MKGLRHFPCDLSQQAALPSVAADVAAAIEQEAPSGPVLLINNSGFGGYGGFSEADGATMLEMIEVNVRALVALTGLMLPLLRRRGGAVVNVASTAAFQPTPWMATYGATKAFVLHWSLSLDAELRGSGVRVLALCPGPTSTRFFERAGLRQGAVTDRLGETPAQVVATALRALSTGRSLAVSGWKNRLMAAVTSRLPKVLAARMAGRVLARYRASMRTDGRGNAEA